MKKRIKIMALLTLAAGIAQATVTVSNLKVAQKPGTKRIEISYDVASTTATVTVSLNMKNGATAINTPSVSGDVGGGITTGFDKKMVWDMAADWNGNVGTLSCTVTADDGVAPPAPSGMVWVQGGTLPDIGNGVITVSSFYIGKYEVTWGEWQTVRNWASANGYDIGSVGSGCADNHPAIYVSWYDIVKWCNARSEKEGLTPVYTVNSAVYKSGQNNNVTVNTSANSYRLPTDAEWEYAARGGTQSHGYTYSGGNDLNTLGWYRGNYSSGAACDSGLGPCPVGQKGANELGLYDMSGNVGEWCFDWYPGFEGSSRGWRSGSWQSDAMGCRVVGRGSVYPSYRNTTFGFRLARSVGL